MSSILGILSKSGKKIVKEDFDKAMDALNHWPVDAAASVVNERVAFGNLQLKTTTESEQEVLPYTCADSGCVIAADARIDYRKALISELNDPGIEPHQISDSQLILKAYLKWGADCTRHVYGDFAFAIWDQQKEALYCARDQFGCRPLFYHVGDDYMAFSTEVKALCSLPWISDHLSENWVVDHGASLMEAAYETPFQEIHRLQPAHHLMLQSGQALVKRYWELEVKEAYSGLGEDEAKEALREHLGHAVRERMRSKVPIGLELSGGLDSSGVAALAAGFCQEKGLDLRAYSQVISSHQQDSGFQIKDEKRFAELMADHLKLTDHVFISGDGRGAFGAIKHGTALFGGPLFQSYALMSDALYEKASKDGVKVLLSGFGGDEGVSNRAHGYFEELIRERNWKLLKRELAQSRGSRMGKTKRLTKYALLFQFPFLLLAFRRIGSRRRKALSRYNSFPLGMEWQRRYQTKRRFLQSISNAEFNSVRKYQKSRLEAITNQNRLENSHLFAQSRGMEYRYPLWDVKLIEFFYSLPSHLKYQNGVDRYLYRKAMEGILPKEICWRRDKTGATVPSAYPRIVRDLDLFQSLLDDCELLDEKHYFSIKKLRQHLHDLGKIQEGHPVRYGTGIFLYVMSYFMHRKLHRP